MAKKILFRKRKRSMKTALGITGAKRKFAKATGIPTTKAGRKRKMLNAATGGTYGKYQRARANVNRPFKTAKRISGGCLVQILGIVVLIALGFTAIISAFS